MILTIWNLINDCLDKSELSELSDSLLSALHYFKLADDKNLVNFCCDILKINSHAE